MVKSQVNSPKKKPQTTFHKVRQDIFLQHFFLFNKKYSLKLGFEKGTESGAHWQS